MGWDGHAERVEQMRINTLSGWLASLERGGRILEDNIKINLTETQFECLD